MLNFMKSWFQYITAIGFVGVVILFFYAASWLVTCGIVRLISFCFGFTFKWSIATGIWLVLCLVKGFLTFNVNVTRN